LHSIAVANDGLSIFASPRPLHQAALKRGERSTQIDSVDRIAGIRKLNFILLRRHDLEHFTHDRMKRGDRIDGNHS
jgi:hypothetical protein